MTPLSRTWKKYRGIAVRSLRGLSTRSAVGCDCVRFGPRKVPGSKLRSAKRLAVTRLGERSLSGPRPSNQIAQPIGHSVPLVVCPVEVEVVGVESRHLFEALRVEYGDRLSLPANEPLIPELLQG